MTVPPASPGADGVACLSVVIPCYNEVATIADVLTRVLEAPATREAIVVDDGSTDGTREVLARFSDDRLTVVEQPSNQGKGAALRRGFGLATAPYVLVQDADLEYDPSEYPVLLEPLLDGRADVVYGSRFVTGGPHRVLYYWHSVGNRVLTTVSNMLTNLNLSDMETCYKVFRREVIQSIELRENGFGFEPEVTAKVARAGYRVYEVGISYSGRTYAEGKKIGWVDGWRALYCVARYSAPGEQVRRRLGRAPWAAERRRDRDGAVAAERGLPGRRHRRAGTPDLAPGAVGNAVPAKGPGTAAGLLAPGSGNGRAAADASGGEVRGRGRRSA